MYNKLVRDNIPDIIKKNGATPIVRILDDEEYFKELNRKLKEELNEYLDGNDIEEIIKAFDVAKNIKNKPTAIIAKTVKGKGVGFMENQAGWHGKAPNDEQLECAIKEFEGEV